MKLRRKKTKDKEENIFMSDIYLKNESEPIEEILKFFCDQHEIDLNNTNDMVSICQKLGIDTYSLPLHEDNLDGLILIEGDLKVIGIDETLNAIDSRFVIAHELGHYMYESLASGGKKLMFAERDKVLHGEEKSERENDMDYLAASMLVPKDKFIQELKSFNILNGQVFTSEEEVQKAVKPIFISFFADQYRVRKQLIVRRIAEVSQYASAV